MGKFNSSIHRVRPLMDVIKNDFQAYKSFLELIHIEGVGIPQSYWYDGSDCKEKQLKPSKQHLIKLIEYFSEKDFGNIEIKNKIFAYIIKKTILNNHGRY